MDAIQGYLYGTSPRDGLPTHLASGEVTFTESDVASWHVSKSHGDARKLLGATLKDGRLVFVLRARLEPALAKRLDKIAANIRKRGVWSGSSRAIGYWRLPPPDPAVG